MASAKPIVATNVAAIPELVENGVNGILVESEDVKGLAGGLQISRGFNRVNENRSEQPEIRSTV
jgi:glycosyltransferase involved in cell wall biosynthesis